MFVKVVVRVRSEQRVVGGWEGREGGGGKVAGRER